MPYGLLVDGPAAVTPIALAPGQYKTVAFVADNGVQGLPGAQLRVALALADGTWQVETVTVDGAVGQTVVTFPNPGATVGLSVQRLDDGAVPVGWSVA